MINMKIAVTDEQPLEDIVRELGRLGFKASFKTKNKAYCVQTYPIRMEYETHDRSSFDWLKGELTTLAELKEIK